MLIINEEKVNNKEVFYTVNGKAGCHEFFNYGYCKNKKEAKELKTLLSGWSKTDILSEQEIKRVNKMSPVKKMERLYKLIKGVVKE